MSAVRPKKHLGQHFLNDKNIAQKIADSLTLQGYENVLEIGPGMGVLTEYLLKKPIRLCAVEVDADSVAYLNRRYPQMADRLIHADFLQYHIASLFNEEPFAVIGNFPYNISSQILFKTLAERHRVPEFCGMFQKEVALRICQQPGSKTYGILSVLAQAFYTPAYLFSVPAQVFTPPPKVESGVIRLVRKENYQLPCNEKLFYKVVKAAFNQRRKTLRNSLKTFQLPDILKEGTIFGQRPEQLSVMDFVELTQKIEPYAIYPEQPTY